ncbi:MAG: hypothetical protein II350_06680 [Clostridia bacterium]|nr:hypothetical protein [Clostridia bacterium]
MRRNAFDTTQKLERLIAAAPSIGLSSIPKSGINTPAATAEHGRAVWFDEAKLVLKVKKLYADVLKKDCFLGNDGVNNYPSGDFHTVYVCEIEEVLTKA